MSKQCGCKGDTYYGFCDYHRAEYHAMMRIRKGIPSLVLIDASFASPEATNETIRQIRAALADASGKSILIRVNPEE